MKSHLSIIAALLLSSTVACETGVDGPRYATLTDPTTGTSIGVKDLDTGEYLFDDGQVVSEEDIDPVDAGNGTENGGLAQKEGAMKNLPKVLPFPWRPDSLHDDLSSGAAYDSGGGGDGTWATETCWTMREGGALCTGCCEPQSDGSYYCWEHCIDKESSSSSSSSSTGAGYVS